MTIRIAIANALCFSPDGSLPPDGATVDAEGGVWAVHGLGVRGLPEPRYWMEQPAP